MNVARSSVVIALRVVEHQILFASSLSLYSKFFFDSFFGGGRR